MKGRQADYDKINDIIDKKLDKLVHNIVFIDLNKEVKLANGIILPEGLSLPIKSEELVDGIKNSNYVESISLSSSVDCMIYLLGCHTNFTYNSYYIDILKSLNGNIEDYVMSKALSYVKKKKYFDALAFFMALDILSERKAIIRYNIACISKELADKAKEMDKMDEYDLYFRLSFQKLKEITDQFPEFPQAHYKLALFYLEKDDNKRALEELNEAYKYIEDENIRKEIANLVDKVSINIEYLNGREKILNGEVMDGLKKLLPILNRYEKWSELKYYIALGYRKIGNYKKAESLLQELLSGEENFPQLYNELGICCMHFSKINEAISYFEKAVNNCPEDIGYLSNLSVAYLEKGDKIRSKEMIDRAYNIDPEDEIVNKCRELLQ